MFSYFGRRDSANQSGKVRLFQQSFPRRDFHPARRRTVGKTSCAKGATAGLRRRCNGAANRLFKARGATKRRSPDLATSIELSTDFHPKILFATPSKRRRNALALSRNRICFSITRKTGHRKFASAQTRRTQAQFKRELPPAPMRSRRRQRAKRIASLTRKTGHSFFDVVK